MKNENFASKIAWTPTQENPEWQKPAFARCKLNYNAAYRKDGSPNMDTTGYTSYWSLDWNNKTNAYDEMEGMRVLITNLILNKPPQATRWASLFINLTLDLDTSKRGYEHKIAHFMGHENKMPKFKPQFMRTIDNSIKIHITDTLMAMRDLNTEMQILKMLRSSR